MATRRTHSLEFNERAVEASRQLGHSIARVAVALGINTNQLPKWGRQFSVAHTTVVASAPTLDPITIVPDEPARSSVEDSHTGRIDIDLGRTRISVTGRVDLDVLHTVLVALRPR